MKPEIAEKTEFLRNYSGRKLRIMEICGSHTAAISKSGLRSLISGQIELISGPGCPVCVTPSSYIDRLIGLSLEKNTTVCVFGDMLRVPGSSENLSMAKGRGGRVKMLYSPLQLADMAEKEPDTVFVFGAVGFETTTPAYALLLEELIEKNCKNVKLLTSLKTMPGAVEFLCASRIDAFLAPGHVCAVRGYREYEGLAEKYGVNFGVAGFEPEELLEALYGLVKMCSTEHDGCCGRVENYYPSAVRREGNRKAASLVEKYFEKCDAVWRGLGKIPGSGLKLKEEYALFDAGSAGLDSDIKKNSHCRCGEVLCGKIRPDECLLYGRACSPINPQGACMVSEEGACRAFYETGR